MSIDDDSLVLERSGSFALLRSGYTWFGIAGFFPPFRGLFFRRRILFPAMGFLATITVSHRVFT